MGDVTEGAFSGRSERSFDAPVSGGLGRVSARLKNLEVLNEREIELMKCLNPFTYSEPVAGWLTVTH